MEKFIKIFFLTFIGITSAMSLTGCKDDSDEPKITKGESLVLIYAVAANNLQPYLPLDMNEMLEAARTINLEKNKVLVYSVDNSAQCILQEIRKQKKTGKYEFYTIKTFPELPLSTSKERIKEVISYVNDYFQYKSKGLVLWSHADGWLPWDASTPEEDKRKSFGVDIYDGKTYKTNITLLSEAIPDGVFDYIWFDCCYMGNIETIYQLKSKAPYIVGYVMEIYALGMPYNLTLPYLMKPQADLEGAAYELYKYYDSENIAVSVSVTDTRMLDELAEASREIFLTGNPPTTFYDIQTYQRNLSVRFYDMGQLLNSYTNVSPEAKNNLKEAFDKAVVCKYITPFDFNYKSVNVKDYSGLSMHHYTPGNGQNEEFYRELDWFKATR